MRESALPLVITLSGCYTSPRSTVHATPSNDNHPPPARSHPPLASQPRSSLTPSASSYLRTLRHPYPGWCARVASSLTRIWYERTSGLVQAVHALRPCPPERPATISIDPRSDTTPSRASFDPARQTYDPRPPRELCSAFALRVHALLAIPPGLKLKH